MKEETGCSPAQLALDKGHRNLGMHLLQAARNRSDDSRSCWSHPTLAKIAELQLAPLIWMIIITLISVFVYKVFGVDSSSVGKGFLYYSGGFERFHHPAAHGYDGFLVMVCCFNLMHWTRLLVQDDIL